MTDHKVAIGIISLFRPNGLRAALESLVDIIIPDGCELILLVVDNDQLASAKPVFDQVSASLKFQCCYFIERLRGIPFARNRVVEEALKLGCSEIAFFDDDEIVSRDWLKKLFEFYRDQSCDIATGPVSPIFPAATPAWRCRIETERFFRPRNLSTGAVIPDVFTHNVIYSSRIFSKLGMRFNEKLATSGGSDTFLSEEARRRGCVMKWLNEVLVYEVVPASRLNFTWGFKRKFRVGVNGTRRFAALDGRWKACETFFKYTIGEFLRASRMLLLSMFLLRPELLIVVVDCMVTSTGLFLGLLGVDYHEYKTIHGA